MRKKCIRKKTIVFEVEITLNSIDYFGQSKRAFRSQGVKGIHSYKQKKPLNFKGRQHAER